MTREEAALVRLRLMAQRAFGAMVENRRGGSEEAQKDLDAIDWAIATIQSKIACPQPDPETGLVPCGCGGKAKVWPSDPTQFTKVVTDYEVGCTECAMTTGWVRGKQENAMKVWNTAMSGGMCNHEN